MKEKFTLVLPVEYCSQKYRQASDRRLPLGPRSNPVLWWLPRPIANDIFIQNFPKPKIHIRSHHIETSEGLLFPYCQLQKVQIHFFSSRNQMKAFSKLSVDLKKGSTLLYSPQTLIISNQTVSVLSHPSQAERQTCKKFLTFLDPSLAKK